MERANLTKIYNRTYEKSKRKLLRSSMPKAEVVLWSRLKGKALGGYKFRRQHSVGKFVLDFYCARLKLAIEVDGDSHFCNGSGPYDRARQDFVESFGISFLRFTNTEIYNNLSEVLAKIDNCMQEQSAIEDRGEISEWKK